MIECVSKKINDSKTSLILEDRYYDPTGQFSVLIPKSVLRF